VPARDPAVRSQVAKIGAHSLQASRNPHALTTNARAKQWIGFLDQVDPNRELPEDERLRRAQHARSAYMARLALRSAKARRARSNDRNHAVEDSPSEGRPSVGQSRKERQ
jgi:hypothetical protein